MKLKTDIIIENGTLLTMNDSDDVLQNHSVVISRDKITDIGKANEIKEKYQAQTTIDATDKIIMPGLINTHTHTGMTLLRGFADDLPLQIWLNKYVFPTEAHFVSPEFVKTSLQLAMLEMILSGTTTFNDMYFYQKNNAEIISEMGMRAMLSESVANFPVPGNENFKTALKYSQEFIDQYKNHELIIPAVAVHAPFTATQEILQATKDVANQNNVSFNIHLSETDWETQTIKERHNLTSTQWLHKLNILDSKTIAAHAIHLTPQDIEIIKKQDVGIAHNPECNMKISSGIAPIPTYLNNNIKVGIGTDGAASNNNLDLLEEIHTMALLHKVATAEPTVLPAKECLKIATIKGAKVIGMENEIGSIEKGKKADIITINTDAPHAIPLYDPYSAIVYALNSNDVNDSIINGNLIMQNRKIIDADINQIKNKAQETSLLLKEELKKIL